MGVEFAIVEWCLRLVLVNYLPAGVVSQTQAGFIGELLEDSIF